MSDSEDDSQKTEEPTHKRLEDARKKGQLVNSKEVNNFFILLAFTLVVIGLMPSLMKETFEQFSPFITSPEDFPVGEGSDFRIIMQGVLFKMLGILALPLLIAVALALAAGFLQTQFNFSW